MEVQSWMWRKHASKASGKEMLAITYYGGLSDTPITEYLPILHDGYAGNKAMQQLGIIARSAGVDHSQMLLPSPEVIASVLNTAKPPKVIEYKKEGKYFRVLRRSW